MRAYRPPNIGGKFGRNDCIHCFSKVVLFHFFQVPGAAAIECNHFKGLLDDSLGPDGE